MNRGSLQHLFSRADEAFGGALNPASELGNIGVVVIADGVALNPAALPCNPIGEAAHFQTSAGIDKDRFYVVEEGASVVTDCRQQDLCIQVQESIEGWSYAKRE
ncbi:Uncharacterised protein [Tsukamurella paurometabola]|uniref:Uncharacterized protein n=1 Tax=Tsukamurella paurometabola TaxID=2061 RepID=A0A3P8JZD5_TSUPA|nr:hypothetical protein [Tsukamurella paurometabola]VDR38639.1 Uncharacterised protein [Tsukamurella paurometabola]